MRIQITYKTDSLDALAAIDGEIENCVAQHGATQEGSGYGPEGRELVFNVFPNTELKRIKRALGHVAPHMKYRGLVTNMTLEVLSE